MNIDKQRLLKCDLYIFMDKDAKIDVQLNPSNTSCIAGEILNVVSRTNPPHHLPHQATHGLLHHLHTSLVHLGILKWEEIRQKVSPGSI